MGERNGVLQELNEAIDSIETPAWARPILRCMKDDHVALRDHLEMHAAVSAAMRQVALVVAGSLAVGFTAWVLSGGLAAVFGP